jgi:dCMP deaminase
MKTPTQKDKKYLSWTAFGAKVFSTCAKRQYMATIVDEYGYVVGVGYNGVPSGFTHCIDGGCPRFERGSIPGTSYDDCLSNHAEANAIMNSFGRDTLRGATLYVNGEPCFTCAKLICNTGIGRVVYTSDPDYVYPEWGNAEDLLVKAGVSLVYIPQGEIYV